MRSTMVRPDRLVETPADLTPPAAMPPATGFSAVFRREDDRVCHTRCRSVLTFRGIRARQEADFYCLVCVATVTVPLAILEALAGGSPPPAALRALPGGSADPASRRSAERRPRGRRAA